MKNTMPGTCAIQVWGLYKTGVLSKEEAIMFWNEIGNKVMPQKTEDIIKELDETFDKVKKLKN